MSAAKFGSSQAAFVSDICGICPCVKQNLSMIWKIQYH